MSETENEGVETLETSTDTQDQTLEDQETEDQNEDDENASEEGQETEDDESEETVTFGDTSQEKDKSDTRSLESRLNELSYKMRKTTREKDQEIKELRAKLEAYDTPTVKPLRKEPTLEDHDYDDEAFKQDHKKWVLEELDQERVKESARQKEDNLKKGHQEKVKAFQDKYNELSYKDKMDSFHEVVSQFDDAQQSIILDAVDNPAMIVYALGKNPKKLDELAKEQNLVKLASKLGILETKMKVTTTRKPSTKPDKAVQGSSGSGLGMQDKKLLELEQKAERTGNYTELFAYRKKLKK